MNPSPAERPASAQQRLLAGAAMAYAERGSHALTVEDILAASGVSRPTFYKCFADKYAAIAAVLREANDMLLEAIDQAVAAAPDAQAKINAAVDAYLGWGVSQGALAVRLYAEMSAADSCAGQERLRTIAAITTLVLREAGAMQLPPGTPMPDPLLLAAVVKGVETLGEALFANPRRIARARVRGHALTLLAAALPLPDVLVSASPRQANPPRSR